MLEIIEKDLNLAEQTYLFSIVDNFEEMSSQFEQLDHLYLNANLIHPSNLYIAGQNCLDIFKINDELAIVREKYIVLLLFLKL